MVSHQTTALGYSVLREIREGSGGGGWQEGEVPKDAIELNQWWRERPNNEPVLQEEWLIWNRIRGAPSLAGGDVRLLGRNESDDERRCPRKP